MKKNFLLACLISAVFAAPAGAWELWDQFKATNLTPEGRVVDYSEAKLITTSEGQSYGMFFALVANDKKAFDEMFAWTEKNLGENQPAWLWGIPDGKPNGTGKILDTNNATDSDMWIAYCLIEAARIWNDPSYLPKADGYLAKLKELVRDVPTVGKIILPGRVGFEEKGVIPKLLSAAHPAPLCRLRSVLAPGAGRFHQRHGALLSERCGAGLG